MLHIMEEDIFGIRLQVPRCHLVPETEEHMCGHEVVLLQMLIAALNWSVGNKTNSSHSAICIYELH